MRSCRYPELWYTYVCLYGKPPYSSAVEIKSICFDTKRVLYISILLEVMCSIVFILYSTSDTHITGPGVTQDSSHIGRGVCHDGVVVEFLLTLLFVFELQENKC